MDSIDVVVETPKGSNYKYKYDKKSDRLKANKILPTGLAFPYDFGYIPGSKDEDGDPLDVMIIAENSFIPGSIVECEILCSIMAEQTSRNGNTVRNDRILVTPKLSLEKDVELMFENFSKNKITEIENFFIYYNKEEGKEFKPKGILNAKETWKRIKKHLG